MTAHEFIQDGIRYVPSRIAAKSADLAPDYIWRMCREGLVLATWHRGAWYVNQKSLVDVLAARRVKLEELAHVQSETLKRERELAEAKVQAEAATQQPINMEAASIPRAHATSSHAARSRALPAVALSLDTASILATSALALPQTTSEKISAQLPFNIPSALTKLRLQHPPQLAPEPTPEPSSTPEPVFEPAKDNSPPAANDDVAPSTASSIAQ